MCLSELKGTKNCSILCVSFRFFEKYLEILKTFIIFAHKFQNS